MSRRIADLLIKVGADTYELQEKFRKVEKDLDRFSGKMNSMGKELSLKVTAPIVALGALSLKMADESESAAAKVQQAIVSTGMAARLNFEQLSSYASQLQGKTIFGDDEILDKSTAQLLTFTRITGENFKRTQALALDLATTMSGDLQAASIQLGKALNDPVRAITLLRKSGIQFSESQGEVIRKLAATGKIAEAQAVILGELEKKYGGQAEAAAKVGLGPLKQLKELWGDFLEDIGSAILPTLNDLIEHLKGIAKWLISLSPETKKMIVIVGGLAAAVGPLLLMLGNVIKMMPLLAAGFTALLSPIGLAVAAVLALGAAFAYAYNRKKEMIDGMADQFSELSDSTLEKRLAENRRQQEIYKNESPWQGNTPAAKIGYAANKLAGYVGADSRENKLINEEKALMEAIKRKTVAQAEANRVAEETKKITDLLNGSLGSENKELEKSKGIIPELSRQIEDLEKKKSDLTNVDDIATLNSQIEKIRINMEHLSTVTAEYLAQRRKIAAMPAMSAGVGFKTAAVTPVIKVNPILEFGKSIDASRAKVGEFLQKAFQDPSIGEKVTIMAARINSLINNGLARGMDFTAATEMAIKNTADFFDKISEATDSFVSNMVSTLADSIGSIIVGDLGLGSLLWSIVGQIGAFISALGKHLLLAAVTYEAFKDALKSLGITGVGAIIVAGAMIVLGSTLAAVANKKAQDSVPKLAKGGLAYGATYAMVGDNPNARVDPEVIAPLSKLKSMIGDGGGVASVQLAGEFKVRGRDLVYVLSQESHKSKILG